MEIRTTRRAPGWLRLVALPAILVGAAATAAPAVAAEPTDPDVQAMIHKGVAFLKSEWPNLMIGRSSLCGYALVKAGEPVSSPEIQQALATVQGRFQDGVYVGVAHEGNYVAGVDLMLLEAVDPIQYRDEMTAIVKYLVGNQSSDGFWDYPNQTNDRGGDTSQMQYVLLGLWAAQRGGIDVPVPVWDKAGQWLVRSQKDDGGFAYTPFFSQQGLHTSSYSMTTAGIGSAAVIRLVLFPSADEPVLRGTESAAPPEPSRKFGVLQRVDPTIPDGEDAAGRARASKPQITAAALNEAAQRGVGWLSRRYQIDGAGERQMYFMYGLERLAALTRMETINGRRWYDEGVELLKRIQLADGRWTARYSHDQAATAWGILFLLRATSKLLGRPAGVEAVGGGLLKGGRGLPSDLSQALVDGGKVQARKIDDPIEKLLAQLEQQDAPQVEAVQQAIVEQVQLGNRDELIGQKDRLVNLVRHPDAEVRRTALWALGRTDDLKLVRLMVPALRDPDLGVRIEAHNALCALSRKPNGFEGLANDPLEGVAEEASEQDQQAAIERWTTAAHQKWNAWYLTVRPYDERDDLQEPRPAAARR